ncbi:alpha/beta fold hydrolase [Luteimonas sp. e5]
MTRLLLTLPFTVMLLAGCGQADQTTRDTRLMLGQLAFEPCSLDAPLGRPTAIEAQCTTFEVPEDRANPDGRRIGLNIAWIPAENHADPAPDPVVFLAGGPGQAAVATFPTVLPAFKDVMKDRGILLIDQRGTGKSNLLNCKRPEQESPADDLAAYRAYIQACIEELSTRADLRHYTTTDAVADLEAVREAIGADQLNLIGVSYGTRMAQQYALRHPGRVRTLTLDSPVPNTLGLGNIFARNLDNALQAQFALCGKDPVCSERVGDPRAELQSLLARLRANPVEVTYHDANTGEQKVGTLDGDSVAGLVRMYAYMPMAGALLPQLIHEAGQGRYSGLMALVEMLKQDMADAMAMGMQMSVVCSEDEGSFMARAEDADTVLGNRLTEAMGSACELWPRGAKPADFNTPLTGELPTLVLTGEFDPITPPAYGEEIAATLPRARWFNLKGQGHNVIGAGCMPKLFAQFIEKADATALDGACLDQLAYVPPFTSLNGWEP